MMFFFVRLFAGAPECDILNVSRAWYPAVLCTVNQTLDFSAPVQNGQVFELVTIGRLASKAEQGRTVWGAVALSAEGRISNSVFMTNATVDLSSAGGDAFAVEVLRVQEDGQLTNVTLCGNVSLQLGGLINRSFSITVRPWSHTQLSSAGQVNVSVGSVSLGQITACSPGDSGSSWCLVTQLADQSCYAYGGNESKKVCVVKSGTIGDAMKTWIQTKVSRVEAAVYERRAGELRPVTLYLPGNQREMESAYNDLYLGMLQLAVELQFETYGLSEAWFDESLGVNFQAKGARLFFSKTRGVMMLSATSALACSDQYIDPILKTCVSSCSLKRTVRTRHYMRFCVDACPSSVDASSSYCECPQHLGLLDSCVACPDGYLSYGSRCVAGPVCLESTVQFGRGCFSECPAGTVQGKVCQEPLTVATCESSFNGARSLLVLYEYGGAGQGRLYNVCAGAAPAGMYRLNSSVYVQRCPQTVGLDGTCSTAVRPVCNRQFMLVVQDNQCRARCLNGQVNNSWVCGDSCAGETYRSALDSCNQCKGGYDGGTFFVRGGMKVYEKTWFCTMECNYQNDSICEAPGPDQCPVWSAEAGQTMQVFCQDVVCTQNGAEAKCTSPAALEAYTKAQTSQACRELKAAAYQGCDKLAGTKQIGEATVANYSCTLDQFRCARQCSQYEHESRCYSCDAGLMLDCLGGKKVCTCEGTCATIYVNQSTSLKSCAAVGTDACKFQYTETRNASLNYCVDSCPSAHDGTQCIPCPRFFSRATGGCVDTCTYVNQSYYYDICEAGPGNGNKNCPYVVSYQAELGTYRCLAECQELYQVSGTSCVACAAGEYWWRENSTCSATACAYFSASNSRMCEQLSSNQCSYYRIEAGKKICLTSCPDIANLVKSNQLCQECPAGSQVTADNTSCKCSESDRAQHFDNASFQCLRCTQGKIYESGTCHCNETQIFSAAENKCVNCSDGAQKLDETTCECPEGSMMTESGCKLCTSQTTYDKSSQKCVCKAAGYRFNGTDCIVCPQGQSFNETSLACGCEAGFIYIKDYVDNTNSRCVACPPDARVVENQCVCYDASYRFDAFVCSSCKVTETNKTGSCLPLCPSTAKWDSQTLLCTCENAYQIFDKALQTCTCPQGQRLDAQKCVCQDSALIYHAGQCVSTCPEGYLRVLSECYKGNACPTGYNNKKDPKVCKPTRPGIDMGTASGIGILVGIVIVIIIWGSMVCKKFRKGPSAESRQKKHKQHIPKARISLERERPKGQVIL